MASISVARSRRSPQPGKLELYQQQVFLNHELENVVLAFRQIETLNIVPRSFLNLYANMVQELRALVNSRIIEELRPIEENDAAYFQRERIKWEARPRPRLQRKTQAPGRKIRE